MGHVVMDRALVSLPEKLTQAQAPAVLAQLRSAASQASTTLVVDGSGLRIFDSAALAVLLDLRRWAQGLQRALRVEGAPAALQRLAQLYGVAGLLGWPEEGPETSAASPVSAG